MTIRIILSLVVFSECLAWVYGATSLWRSRNATTGLRTTLGILLAFLFTLLGIVQFIATVSSLNFIAELSKCIPPALAYSSLATSTARSMCAWSVALVVAGGDSPGPVRRRINSLAERWK